MVASRTTGTLPALRLSIGVWLSRAAESDAMKVNAPAPPDDTPAPARPPAAPAASPESRQAETNARVAGATAILAAGNILSRALGLMRETVMTYFFGATAAVDAYQVAVIIPKAIYDLLIGGHINGAIVPVLSEIVTLKGRTELWRVVSLLLSLAAVALALLVLLLQVFALPLVQLTAGGADAATLALAAELLRLTAPALVFMGLFAVLSGTLYALKKFTLPALAGLVFNGCIVAFTMLFAPPLRPTLAPGFTLEPLAPLVLWRDPQGVTAVAAGWLVGALAQMLLQLPALRGSHLRFSLHWRHPAFRSIALLYAPVMFSLVMDTLIIRPFSYNLASQTGSGSIAYMNWATTLIQFPQGLVATAISVAILPTLAGQAALVSAEHRRAFKDTLGLGLRLATTLIVPATAGLFLLANPIIALLFEHGAFTVADTNITALALRLYLVGLPFAAIDLLLVYAFYARKDTLTPALVGILSLAVYMVVAVALLPHYGLFSLMIADSLKHIVHALVAAVLLRQRLQGFARQRLIVTALKALAAAAGMMAAGMLLLPLLTALIGTQGLLREALLVLAAGGVCVVVFVALALWLRIEEFTWALRLVRGRLLR
ncbi:MAG: murein biosynthesis integral membrane protein MurJ [Anaerolineae bacterium]|jgi:putative peptidoglycan lipid II flippase|nr:murein biosynthesis integral membrane protein MurJ [Anaerolineae bacterium]